MKQTLNCILLVLPLWVFPQKKKNFHSKWQPPIQSDFAFKIAIPEGNHLYLNKGTQYGSSFGFLGLSVGFEYYLSDKYCINMDVGLLTDNMIPVPAAVDYFGPYDVSSAFFGDLQIGTDWKRFHFDVGIQHCRTRYAERETVSVFPDYVDSLKLLVEERTYGLSLSGYFRISRTFNIGLNYYPSFIVKNDQGARGHYAHLLFLDLIFRIRWR